MNSSPIDFATDVIAASRIRPVLVDFWAAWCGPCKMLGPILEKLAAEAAGQWSLVKIDVDAHPELAQRYGIRGIPDVRLFAQGEEVNRFAGALPEPQLRDWIRQNLPTPKRETMARARELLRAGRAGDAFKLLEPLSLAEPGNFELVALAARAELFAHPARALKRIAAVPTDSAWKDDAEIVTALATALTTLTDRSDAGAAPPTRATYLNALGHLRDGKFRESAAGLVDVLMDDPQFDRGHARAACLALFRHLGMRHPVSEEFTRRYSMAVNV